MRKPMKIKDLYTENEDGSLVAEASRLKAVPKNERYKHPITGQPIRNRYVFPRRKNGFKLVGWDVRMPNSPTLHIIND